MFQELGAFSLYRRMANSMEFHVTGGLAGDAGCGGVCDFVLQAGNKPTTKRTKAAMSEG